MPKAALNLIVLRSVDLERSAHFYGLLGLAFAREQHGSGPEHLVSQIGSVVLEVYPAKSGEATTALRLGFHVESVGATVAAVQNAGFKVVSPPKESRWELRAVVLDPDGHRIELSEPRIDNAADLPTIGKARHLGSLAGILKDHPDVSEVEENIREYRRQVDADPNRP